MVNIDIKTKPRPPYSIDDSVASRQKLVDYYNSLGRGNLEVIHTDIMLNSGESAFYETEALNIREQAVLKTGATWEIQNIVYTGNSVLSKLILNRPLLEGALLDEGCLLITTYKLMFAGKKTAFTWKLGEIINAKASGNVIQIFPNGCPSVYFAVDDILLFLKILEGAKRKTEIP
jgi:hypothetical protein